MGLIRVSEDAENKIKSLAEASGRTVTSTVDALLQSNDMAARMDKMAKWLDKKFTDLEANITGLVVSTPSRAPVAKHTSRVELPWPVVQDIMFDIATDEWLPGREAAARSSDMLCDGSFFTDGEVIFSDDAYGKQDWLKVSPKIQQYLDSVLKEYV